VFGLGPLCFAGLGVMVHVVPTAWQDSRVGRGARMQVHYNSIYPLAEPPAARQDSGPPEKQKIFGSKKLHRLIFA
jgi:hypothetical protein